jgi:hypothetical protein
MAQSSPKTPTAESLSSPQPGPAMRKRPPCRDSGGDARSAELIAGMKEHQQAISTHHGALLHDIAEFDRAGSWRGDGAINMTAWLTNHLHISPSMARTYVAAAEKLVELPRMADALSEGSLTLDVVAPLAAVARPEDDARLAEAAPDWTVRQARELAEAVRGATDQDAADQFERRSLRFNDEQRSLWAQLPKDKYFQVKSALTARARRMDEARRKSHAASGIDYEPFDRLQADALFEVCAERGRRDGGPSFGGSPASVVVHVDVDLLAESIPKASPDSTSCPTATSKPKPKQKPKQKPEAGCPSGGGYAAIEGLGPISAEVARRLCCDAKISVSLDGSDGSCLDLKPLQRYPSAAQRTEIRRRDNGCRFPGCGFTNYTDVHHMVLFTEGGKTTLDNLITLCSSHHHAVHEIGWKMSGDANAKVTFTGPHGRSSTSSPSPVWRRSLPLRR